MADKTFSEDRLNWNCAKCNSVLQVEVNTRYGTCSTCGETFGFEWADGQLERFFALEDIETKVKTQSPGVATQVSREKIELELRELNDSIRRLEMTKSGERIRAIAIFALICTIIYFLFSLTVHGITRLTNPELIELIVAGVAAFAFLIITVYRLYRAAVVRKCNGLIARRNKIEEELKDIVTSHKMQQSVMERKPEQTTKEKQPDSLAAEEASTDKSDGSSKNTDIIEEFASRKKQRRSRLNIRDES